MAPKATPGSLPNYPAALYSPNPYREPVARGHGPFQTRLHFGLDRRGTLGFDGTDLQHHSRSNGAPATPGHTENRRRGIQDKILARGAEVRPYPDLDGQRENRNGGCPSIDNRYSG